MISILDPRTWIAAIVLCAAALGIGYWRGNVAGRAAVQAKWDAEKRRQEQAVLKAEHSGQVASADYQKGKANEQERIQVVRETVIRTVSGPCLDADGLRLANEAIGGLPAASAAR